MLNLDGLLARSIAEQINLDRRPAVGSPADLVALCQLARNPEAKDAFALAQHRGVAFGDEAGSECRRPFLIQKAFHMLHKILPAIRREIVAGPIKSGSVALLKVEGCNRRLLTRVNSLGPVRCR